MQTDQLRSVTPDVGYLPGQGSRYRQWQQAPLSQAKVPNQGGERTRALLELIAPRLEPRHCH